MISGAGRFWVGRTLGLGGALGESGVPRGDVSRRLGLVVSLGARSLRGGYKKWRKLYVTCEEGAV